MKLVVAAIVLLLKLSSCDGPGVNSGGPATTIGQYTVDSLQVRQDTVSQGDSARASLGVILDCLTTITRIDTAWSAAGAPPYTVRLAVYGTIWTGPGPRPLCAARLLLKDVAFLLPRAGAWIIEVSEPPGTRLPLRHPLFVK